VNYELAGKQQAIYALYAVVYIASSWRIETGKTRELQDYV